MILAFFQIFLDKEIALHICFLAKYSYRKYFGNIKPTTDSITGVTTRSV